MRILLKKGNKYISIYYIKRKKNNNCIVGWSSSKEITKKIFPEIETMNSDIHFTYYKNGNFHTSIKYVDESINKIERRIYYNNVTVKNISKNTIEIFDKSEVSPFEGLLTPDFKAPSFDDKSLLFNLTSIGFNLSSDKIINEFNNITENNNTTPKNDDLIIDIDIDNNYYINASAILMGSDYIEQPITNPNFNYDKIIEIKDNSNSPIIKLRVYFHLNK